MKYNIYILRVLILFLLLFCGCSNNFHDEKNSKSNKNELTKDEVIDISIKEETGKEIVDTQKKVIVSGSARMDKIVRLLAEEFNKIYPNIEVSYEVVGSAKGLKNVVNGNSDLGAMIREYNPSELIINYIEN